MQPGALVQRRVSLTALKGFALELPVGALRDDILSQPDQLPPEEFIASARMWLRLARAR
jgi:hypothetical protein